MPRAPDARDNSLATYRAKRDFRATPEPRAARARASRQRRFVVQKHDARRLHWDFRLEHDGVLLSWAVPKGPSLDPADKRLAVRVEDHPLDYADFHGAIPEGNYGAGEVEIWDSGSWEPLDDPAAGLAAGELKFRLKGQRLQGGFVLVRMKRRGRERAENWLLIKEHDEAEQPGADAEALEALPGPQQGKVPEKAKPAAVRRAETAAAPEARPADIVTAKPAAPKPRPPGPAPMPGAVQGPLPEEQKPELATLVDAPPEGEGWLSEVKFDGYRLLVRKHGRSVRLITRNGLDWSARLPEIVRAVAKLKPDSLLLDGELVALREDGLSSFANLQAALANGGERSRLFLYLFDLLHLEGWDLRGCRLMDRKAALKRLNDWRGALRFSDHLDGEAPRVRRRACAMGLEGIICKRAEAPYRAARTRDWVKVKCQGRDEFIILGWTPPAGSRQGLGSLHLGFHDQEGRLHYVGGVGTGFTEKELVTLSRRLSRMVTTPPEGLLLAGEPPDPALNWVRPELVAEVQYIGWTGFGRLRHATFLGLREDKGPEEVVRDIPHPEVERMPYRPRSGGNRSIVHAAKPERGAQQVGGTRITHADRELWPGITKQDLAEYWRKVAPRALPGIADRPLALLRCPEGIEGERFFQKHANRGLPDAIETGEAEGQPFLAVSDETGLLACAQMAAIELHGWGATRADPAHPDRIVFDLDPGEDVAFAEVVQAALDLRKRLQGMQLESFCRTTGGKGLHVVVPLRPEAGWEEVRDFAHTLARTLEAEAPDRFISTVSKAKRHGRILVDWLRNGAGATAICSYSPRARPGATVATPLAWREVNAKLDPQAFTIATVPPRLARQKRDPWAGMESLDQRLPKEIR
ncbi:DNA ligase D [Siccirubricoccus sp. KC 17139]|uniref:DNA ligase (ATP) n=1 Tax=Siccirubricoccus soli TaxID=2899147 RepID=A0ABT1DCU6_9PROT|nr:DNA ligase D [Siccirubricoccus soli]MCO6419009.1 DNA ligase D [Siccirubricoccus soli]MCP2685144.1 DNA ligase D [Siccirubricoccus soli]